LKPTIILGITGACKNGTGDNSINGKLGRNGTMLLNFSKLKPQILHPKPPTFEPFEQLFGTLGVRGKMAQIIVAQMEN